MKNPISENWYADPESRVYGDTVYMYVTRSRAYEDQLNIDLVTTSDLENFNTHYGILDISTFNGVKKAVWAPTIVDKNGKYYLVFAANDIHSEDEIGGLYIGESETPIGPFKNVFSDGRPLLNSIYNNAQPIDAHLFRDDDGAVYLYYGGWGHLMVCKMNDSMDGFETMPEPCFGGIARELTPKSYVEAPYVMKIDGRYHLMYSSGSWTNGTYCVKAAASDTPLGDFTYYADILSAGEIANGPGHNSAFCHRGKWYIAYHRRAIGDSNPHHRRLCIDELPIHGGRIHTVTMT